MADPDPEIEKAQIRSESDHRVPKCLFRTKKYDHISSDPDFSRGSDLDLHGSATLVNSSVTDPSPSYRRIHVMLKTESM